MGKDLETPFESIEGAQDYVRLLADAVLEARQEVESDISGHSDPHNRRLHALRLVSYELKKLEQHMKSSRRILNDLRSLRRLLFEERRQAATSSDETLSTAEQVHESEQYW